MRKATANPIGQCCNQGEIDELRSYRQTARHAIKPRPNTKRRPPERRRSQGLEISFTEGRNHIARHADMAKHHADRER